MSVLDREALEQSPLADLHAIASELSIDSYRLLRREPLIDAILARQEGADGASGVDEEADEAIAAPPPSRPRRRRTRARGSSAESAERAGSEEPETEDGDSRAAAEAEERGGGEEPEAHERRGRGRAGRAGRGRAGRAKPETTVAAKADEPAAEEPATPAEAEEREASDRTRFEAAPAKFPDSPLRLGTDDPHLAAVEALAPFGLGSRVTIVGPARAGKTELLRHFAAALQGRDELETMLVLVGVRPEEVGEWQAGTLAPAQALSFAAPTSAQDRAVYAAIDEVRPIALRGGNAVILLDTLDGLHEHAARRALATARNLLDGGSVTVIATASEPFGGETTVIALDPTGESFPALDPRLSGTLRVESLLGEEGAAVVAGDRAARIAAAIN